MATIEESNKAYDLMMELEDIVSDLKEKEREIKRIIRELPEELSMVKDRVDAYRLYDLVSSWNPHDLTLEKILDEIDEGIASMRIDP